MTEQPPSPPVRVTIVMYHYVRRTIAARFPRLPALDVERFRGQLDYIRKHYSPVALMDVAAAARGERTLPPRPIVLTFDDGYADHYRDAWPLLRSAGVPATFFLVSSSLIGRRMLDVNRIQFVLAAADSPEPIVRIIEEAIVDSAGRADVRSIDDYRAAGWKAVRYDSAPISYVKYLLQGALPEELRASVLDALFARFVSSDERAFAEELYLGVPQALEMIEQGARIGCHADRHLTLASLSRDEQAREIDGALRVLDALALPRSPFVFSYAKGAHNADSIDLLGARGCTLAVTNRPDIAGVPPNALLALPRLDTNHLPTDGDAPPNEWTRRA